MSAAAAAEDDPAADAADADAGSTMEHAAGDANAAAASQADVDATH